MKSSGYSRSDIRPRGGKATKRPSILGIWRLGRPIHRSSTTELTMAQPADAAGSPRWDYVVKRTLQREDIESCQQITRFAAAAVDAIHPNLIAVLDASTSAVAPYVVMPRLEGMTMQRCLEQAEAKPFPVTLWLVRQVAQALTSLHAAGWVHGDVKPSNVMVGSRGHVTLVDLGFATRVHTVSAGRFRGTPQYASPESLVDNIAALPPMDIFSLGMVLDQWIRREDRLDRQALAPAIDLMIKMTSPDCNDRPAASEVSRQLLRLEIEMLGRHIGPQNSRSDAA